MRRAVWMAKHLGFSLMRFFNVDDFEIYEVLLDRNIFNLERLVKLAKSKVSSIR